MKTMQPAFHAMRWHRPVGVWLLLWPALWGVLWNRGENSIWIPLCLCVCGAFLMRSAGCVYNDMVDRDYDCHVKRTASRPLACGALGIKSAIYIIISLILASGLLLFFMPPFAQLLSVISLILVGLYPWMKRWTRYPQIFLGITFNVSGLCIGYAMVHNTLAISLIFLVGLGVVWTVIYDTIYACQDMDDDLKLGLGSTALTWKGRVRPLTQSLACSFPLWVFIAGIAGPAHSTLTSFVLSLWTVPWAVWTWITLGKLDLTNPDACQRWFEYNTWWGGWMSLGLGLSDHL